MLRLKSIFCLLQAFLLLISSFESYESSFKLRTDRAAMAVTSVSDFGFDAITADDAEISEEEKANCRAWFDNNIRTADNPAYDFTVNGECFRKHLAEWDITVGEESEIGKVYRNGKTSVIMLNHKKSDLTASVEATIYEDYATCEWTVFIENNGQKNSPRIKNFYAADCTLDTGLADVYFNYGSDCQENDFKILKSSVSVTPMTFNANGGRTSSFLPYFNIDGQNNGVLAAVGWTGQWYASLRQTPCGVAFTAKQEFFNTCLTPGEKVRSPLVSLTFYKTGNPLKGYNIYRNYSKDCLINENIKQRVYQCAGGGINDVKATLEAIKTSGIDSLIDTFWFDAECWYYDNSVSNWSDSVGDWKAREDWFPNGFGEVSELLKNNGIDTLLWFEPERIRENTLFYNICNENGWLISHDSDNYMLNLADENCFEWFCNYMITFFKENNLDEYRQDFNFTPLYYWLSNDQAGRTGITENHYVTNLYRFLDTMLSQIDNLRIDNCASGGRRIDPEMMRRSVPLWRSDYMCSRQDNSSEANQMQRYGLSLILPYSSMGYPWAVSEYDYISAMNPIVEVYWEQAVADAETCRDFLIRYNRIKSHFLENYYPLSNAANLKDDSWTAMQYGTQFSGIITAFRHKKADETITINLSGLNENAVYILSFPFDDSKASFSATGESLARGLTVKADAAPEAVVIEYVLTD